MQILREERAGCHRFYHFSLRHVCPRKAIVYVTMGTTRVNQSCWCLEVSFHSLSQKAARNVSRRAAIVWKRDTSCQEAEISKQVENRRIKVRRQKEKDWQNGDGGKKKIQKPSKKESICRGLISPQSVFAFYHSLSHPLILFCSLGTYSTDRKRVV